MSVRRQVPGTFILISVWVIRLMTWCFFSPTPQFSHGRDELRPVLRHPKYKTEVCRTFAQNGTCPYGTRCRFIHQRAPTKSVLGTLIAAAHVVVPSDWRPEGKPGAGAGGRARAPQGRSRLGVPAARAVTNSVLSAHAVQKVCMQIM